MRRLSLPRTLTVIVIIIFAAGGTSPPRGSRAIHRVRPGDPRRRPANALPRGPLLEALARRARRRGRHRRETTKGRRRDDDVYDDDERRGGEVFRRPRRRRTPRIVARACRRRPGTPDTLPARAAQASRLSAVLSVYALMDARVGYCQGMNEIAAFFLDNVPDESEAFWCFSTFLEAYRPHFVISGGSSSSGSSARRGEAFEARGGSSSPGRSGATSRRSSIDGGGEGSTVGEKEPRPFAATVRERLGELGRILERCDPPMWKHVQLLGGSECMFAFRAVVVLLARELPPSEAAFLWETLMAARDHVEDPRALQPGAGPGEMWAAKKNAGAPREKNLNPTAGSRGGGGGGGGGVRKKPRAPEEEEDGVSSPREEGFPKKGSPEEGGGDADGGATPAEGGSVGTGGFFCTASRRRSRGSGTSCSRVRSSTTCSTPRTTRWRISAWTRG